MHKQTIVSLFFGLCALINFTSAQASQISDNPIYCYQANIESKKISAVSFEAYLTCLSGLPTLTKIGAQWIFLRKAHWSLGVSASKIEYAFAKNPMDPTQKNTLFINFDDYSSNKQSFFKLVETLETRIFPEAMMGFTNDTRNNKTAWAYEATMHQLVSLMDTPLPYWPEKETAKVHYNGTLLESVRFPKNWISTYENKYSVLKWLNLGDQYWTELRQILQSNYKICETACFLRQERKILEALFVGLEHPELVEKVHFHTLIDFGPTDGEFSGVQSALPLQYGCYGDYPFQDSPTGIRSYDFSLIGSESRMNFAEYGKWALIGRALYIEAINKTEINPSVRRVPSRHDGRDFDDAPAHYTGQNAIIRDMSDRAVESLIRLGGLGGSSEIEKMDGRVVQATGIKATEAIEKYLNGASYLLADYQRKKYLKQSVANHPVTTEAFFTETIISKGYSIKTWADILSRLNPPVFYHIFAYDYEFQPRHGLPWRSYFDRLVFVINNKFKETTLN